MQIGCLFPSAELQTREHPRLASPLSAYSVYLCASKATLEMKSTLCQKRGSKSLFSLLLKATDRFITESDEAKQKHTCFFLLSLSSHTIHPSKKIKKGGNEALKK